MRTRQSNVTVNSIGLTDAMRSIFIEGAVVSRDSEISQECDLLTAVVLARGHITPSSTSNLKIVTYGSITVSPARGFTRSITKSL